MVIDLNQALEAMTAAAEEVNLSSADGTPLVSTDPDAPLYGEGSGLDSIGLVNVVMMAEAHLADLTGVDIVLASEAAMSRKRSPYRSLRALAEYAVEQSVQVAAE